MIEYNKKSYFFFKYIDLADIVSLEIYLVASAPLKMNKKKKKFWTNSKAYTSLIQDGLKKISLH